MTSEPINCGPTWFTEVGFVSLHVVAAAAALGPPTNLIYRSLFLSF